MLDGETYRDYKKKNTRAFIPVTSNNCLILNAGLSWPSSLGCCLSSCNVHKALHRDLCCSILFWMTMLARACLQDTKYAVLQGDSITRKMEQYRWPYKISLQCFGAVCLSLVCREHSFIFICSPHFSGADRGGRRESQIKNSPSAHSLNAHQHKMHYELQMVHNPSFPCQNVFFIRCLCITGTSNYRPKSHDSFLP